GFQSNDTALIGKHLLELNGEYRHTFMNDLDFDWGELVRIRKLQGALFADAGKVTDTAAEQLVSGLPNNSYNIAGLFDPSDYFTDIGYGLRIYFDAFGVRNSLLRLDVANPVGHGATFAPRYYIAFNQAF